MQLIFVPLLCCVIFCCLRVVSSVTLFPGSTSVVNLAPDEFRTTVVEDNRHWAVALYADWCPHCQFFAPKWEELATKYSKQKGILLFGALNCAQYTNFCNELGVEGYPTLRVWHFPKILESETFRGFDIPGLPIKARVDKWLASHEADLASTNLPMAPTNDGSAPAPISNPVEPASPGVGAQLRLHDAVVALLYAFHQGVFLQSKKINSIGEAALGEHVLADLLSILDFLSGSFPNIRVSRDVATLAAQVRKIQAAKGQLTNSEWKQTLDDLHFDDFPPEAGTSPQKYWKLCRTYTCGLWSLFHIMSLGSANASAVSSSTRRLQTPARSLLMIRTFVARFFGCKSCVEHFLTAYDSCAFDRCRLEDEDTVGAATWLWKVHNNVTIRVARENKLPTPAPWPLASLCPSCWVNERAVNTTIYSYLRDSYWPSPALSSKLHRMHMSSNFWLVVALIVFGVVCISGLAALCFCHTVGIGKDSDEEGVE